MKAKLFILLFILASQAFGQLFHPLGIGKEKCGLHYNGDFQPQMHIESNVLYVCTNQGLYSKDLAIEESSWKLVGFEGIPLQDYARRGDDILALRYNERDSYLLLSHDGGQTYEDITPEMLKQRKGAIYSLVQKPGEPSTLLIPVEEKIYRSSDFGQTWEGPIGNFHLYLGYHDQNPEIMYSSGYFGDVKPIITISYDGGLTWKDEAPYCGEWYIHNGVFRMAFHPTVPDRWLAGGWGCVYTSEDNGHTWRMTHISMDGYSFSSSMRFSLFDSEDGNIAYIAGFSYGEIHIIFSTDGGTTWNTPHIEPAESTPEIVNDLKQHGDKLYVYTESDVYEISKAELLQKGTAIKKVAGNAKDGCIYDLEGRKYEHSLPLKGAGGLGAMRGLPRGVYIKSGKKIVVK